MSFEDKTIICADCGNSFVHSADDQARYAERGFTNEPKRCRECREKRKSQGSSERATRTASAPRPMRPKRDSFEAVCSQCGAPTTVPFQPKEGRPVYCRDCFRSKRR